MVQGSTTLVAGEIGNKFAGHVLYKFCTSNQVNARVLYSHTTALDTTDPSLLSEGISDCGERSRKYPPTVFITSTHFDRHVH